MMMMMVMVTLMGTYDPILMMAKALVEMSMVMVLA
jgi:hypothetical protein